MAGRFSAHAGAEISKVRPAIVVSLPDVGILPLKMVVPVTDWKEHYSRLSWFTRIEPSNTNGLSKRSGADAFQCRSVSFVRFQKKHGILGSGEMENVIAGIIACVSISDF